MKAVCNRIRLCESKQEQNNPFMEKSMETVNSQDTCRNQVKWTFSWEHNERIFADGILSECEHILKKSDITGTKQWGLLGERKLNKWELRSFCCRVEVWNGSCLCGRRGFLIRLNIDMNWVWINVRFQGCGRKCDVLTLEMSHDKNMTTKKLVWSC